MKRKIKITKNKKFVTGGQMQKTGQAVNNDFGLMDNPMLQSEDEDGFYNIQDQYAQNPTDSTEVLQGLMKEGAFENLSNQGYTAGDSGVVKQHATKGVEGFAGGLTPEDYMNADPKFMKNLFPDGFDNSFENREKFRSAVMADPKRAAQIQGKEGDQGYKRLGADWLQSLKTKQPVKDSVNPESPKSTRMTMDKMGSITPNVVRGNTPGLAPMKDKQLPPEQTKPEKGTIPKDPLKKITTEKADWMKYAPIAGAVAAGFLPSPEIDPYNPTTISSGLLKPQQVDEMSMRAGIDSANRANIGAITNASGGSGSAQRAALLGQGANYMKATGNAFMNANQMNNQATQQADQFNIQNQGNIAAQNQGAINQADMYNTETLNQQKQSDFGRKVGAISDIAGQFGDIGEANARSNTLNKMSDYDTDGNYQIARRTEKMSPMESQSGQSIQPFDVPETSSELMPMNQTRINPLMVNNNKYPTAGNPMMNFKNGGTLITKRRRLK